MKVVVVESPSKAKTINKYLGNDYKVLASYGHVRDLPSKNGSVSTDHDFEMIWEETEGAHKQINEIKQALKSADKLYLATDPDREGEAISWHVYEVLSREEVLKNVDVKRVVFYEVTKRAVNEALTKPRDLNKELIDAYLARRALDYLVGFTLSPLLWHKLPGGRSAGRVQSVALRLVAEREQEIENFISQEYWTIESLFHNASDKEIQAKLTHFNGEKLEKFSITNEKTAHEAKAEIEKHTYSISKVEKKKVKRNPNPPFITSTLQQEASRKLGFSARKTMQVAQKLYEGINLDGEAVGLITYMRTDSVTLSQEAIVNIRSHIQTSFGDPYLPPAPRTYKSSAKNAQEAHEAIRPTEIARTPATLKNILEEDLFKLYDLIWKRTIASQMESAVLDQVSIDFSNPDQKIIFRASGSTIAFDGFLKLYEESKDDNEDDDENKTLPPVAEGEAFDLKELTPHQHFTQPPPRFTEASLVKKLEELGIGRPSTYASILSTLLERKYVHLEKRQMVPEPIGRLVTAFLEGFFKKYIEYDFTAKLEQQLDDIAQGKLKRLDVLKEFWDAFHKAVDQASDLKISDVIDRLNKDLEKFIFSNDDEKKEGDFYLCPKCNTGHLSLKLGKYGAFVGCSNYPECQFTRQLTPKNSSEQTEETKQAFETKVLGQDPNLGIPVTLRKGPYGFYVQWDEEKKPSSSKKKKTKPKRIAVPRHINPLELTLEQALSLGALPRDLGEHPETHKPVSVGVGRFGPYIKHNDQFTSLGKDYDVLTINLKEALEVLSKPKIKREKPAGKSASKKKK
jgi:DNA topoisomerase-1